MFQENLLEIGVTNFKTIQTFMVYFSFLTHNSENGIFWEMFIIYFIEVSG